MKHTRYAMLLSVLVVSASVLIAQPRPERGERMMKELGLSDEQTAKIEELRTTHMKSMADQRASVTKAKIDLRSLMSADEPNKAAITSKMKEIADLRLRQETARVDHMFDVRTVLTPEQQKMFREHMGDRMRGHRGRGFRPGRGMGGGMDHDGPRMRERMHR